MLLTSLFCLGVATFSLYLSQKFSEDLKYLAFFIAIIFVFLTLVFIPIWIKLAIVVGLGINNQLINSGLKVN